MRRHRWEMAENQLQIEKKPPVTGPAPAGGFAFAEEKATKQHIFKRLNRRRR